MRVGLTIALAFSLATAAVASDVRVVDGDTLEVDGTMVRLFGIDAPEAGQRCARRGRRGSTWPCGRDAISALERFVRAGDLTCDDRGSDDFGRRLAVCAAGGVDVNRRLVESGMAWAYWRYSDRYGTAEDDARRRRAGIWQSPTEPAMPY